MILYSGTLSGGTLLTQKLCAREKKLFIALNSRAMTKLRAAQKIAEFVEEHDISVLNVAGTHNMGVCMGAGAWRIAYGHRALRARRCAQCRAPVRAMSMGGVTPRSANDCLIATHAILGGMPLLHLDRDFDLIVGVGLMTHMADLSRQDLGAELSD